MKSLVPAMVVLAIVSFYLRPQDKTNLNFTVDSVTAVPMDHYSSNMYDLLDRINGLEESDTKLSNRFTQVKWRPRTSMAAFGETAPAAPAVKSGGSNGSYAVAPTYAVPVRSGGSNGSYAAPVRSGGSNGSYAATATVAQSTVTYSAPVYATQVVSGGSNGSYSTAAPRVSSVPIATTRVRMQPFRTVARAVASGGCNGGYSMQATQVPVRGPVRKAVANFQSRRQGTAASYAAPAEVVCVEQVESASDVIVSPYAAPAAPAPAAPVCGCDPCACDPCQCAAAAAVSAVIPRVMAPVARVMAPAVNFVDGLTPMRSSSRVICTPQGCVVVP